MDLNSKVIPILYLVKVNDSTRCVFSCCDFAGSYFLSSWCFYSCFDFLSAISSTKILHPDHRNPLSLAHRRSRPRDFGTWYRPAFWPRTSCPRASSTPPRQSRPWRRRRSRRRPPPSCGPSGLANCRWLAARWLSHDIGTWMTMAGYSLGTFNFRI